MCEREREINVNTIAEEVMSRLGFFEEKIEARVTANGIDVNLSSSFTAMIKEAAKCNRFSSDLVYDIQIINERLNFFDLYDEESYSPILIACRKDGVDGNGFILSRVENASQNCAFAICFPEHYFSVFAITFTKSEDFDLGYVNIHVKGVHV
jgi:hypothetical protein